MTAESKDKGHLPPVPTKVAASCLHAFAEAMSSLSAADGDPLIKKLTRPVATSVHLPLSLSKAGIKVVSEKTSIVERKVKEDPDISPLSEEEKAEQAQHLFTSPHLLINAEALWQIGRAGRKCPDLHWSESYTYSVGNDEDPINHPTIPEYLVPATNDERENATSKLTLSFLIEPKREGASLIFCYQRWGGGKDLVSLDDKPLCPVSGLGTGRMRNVQLVLPPLNSGRHSITLRSDSSSITSTEYRVDQFMLIELPNSASAAHSLT